jgi:hypothetical protein
MYRIEAGERFSLADCDPADTGSDELPELVARIADLQARLYAEERRAVLVVLQGIDAAGKDSTVAHVFRGTNPQGVRVYSFKEPSNEELAHDFLWRYHQHTPGKGMIHVFNRSHYEDVLVVRVEHLVEEQRCATRAPSGRRGTWSRPITSGTGSSSWPGRSPACSSRWTRGGRSPRRTWRSSPPRSSISSRAGRRAPRAPAPR